MTNTLQFSRDQELLKAYCKFSRCSHSFFFRSALFQYILLNIFLSKMYNLDSPPLVIDHVSAVIICYEVYIRNIKLDFCFFGYEFRTKYLVHSIISVIFHVQPQFYFVVYIILIIQFYSQVLTHFHFLKCVLFFSVRFPIILGRPLMTIFFILLSFLLRYIILLYLQNLFVHSFTSFESLKNYYVIIIICQKRRLTNYFHFSGFVHMYFSLFFLVVQ